MIQRIILAFDGDSAGEKAAEKSTQLGLSLGMEVKFAALTEGKDPAELVKSDPNLWKTILRDSLPAIEYFLNRILEKEKDGRKAGRLIEKKLLPLVALIQSAIERSHYISVIAKRTGIREDVLLEDLRQVKIPDIGTENEVENKVEKPPLVPRKTNIERRLVGIVFWQEGLPQPIIDVTTLKSEVSKRLESEYYEKLIELLSTEKEALIFEAENYYSSPDKLSKDITELLNNLSDDVLREKLAVLLSKLSRAEVTKDQRLVTNLSGKIQKVHQKMTALEEKRKKL